MGNHLPPSQANQAIRAAMVTALEDAASHMTEIRQLQAGLGSEADRFTQDIFERIKVEQRNWRREMDRYRKLAASLQ